MRINEPAVEKRDRLRRIGQSQEGFAACSPRFMQPPFLLYTSLFSVRVEVMLTRVLRATLLMPFNL
jgi:hypothetical protein